MARTPDPKAEVNALLIQNSADCAMLLLDHAKALRAGLRSPQWVGEAEVRRRAFLLLRQCNTSSRKSEPIPQPLLDLIQLLLCGDVDPWSGKSEQHKDAWVMAAGEESLTPLGEDGNPFTADVSAVARVAFPSNWQNQRKTIKEWRKDMAYVLLVCDLRMGREIREAKEGGASPAEVDAVFDRHHYDRHDLSLSQMISGLRLTAKHPWGKK